MNSSLRFNYFGSYFGHLQMNFLCCSWCKY